MAGYPANRNRISGTSLSPPLGRGFGYGLRRLWAMLMPQMYPGISCHYCGLLAVRVVDYRMRDGDVALWRPTHGSNHVNNSVRVFTVNELVERVLVDALQMPWHVWLRHFVQVVTAQQLVLARTAVVDLRRLQSLVTQSVTLF